MITIHGPDGAILSEPKPEKGFCWVNVTDPGGEDIKRLIEMANIEAEFIGHALDMHECPRIEGGEKATIVIVRAPYLETKWGEPRYSTIPIGIIVYPDMAATICRVHDPVLSGIPSKAWNKRGKMDPAQMICSIIKEVSILFMTHLKDLSNKIQDVERDLAASRSNADLKNLLILQKSVTYFHSALRTNDFIIDRLIRKGLQVGNIMSLKFSEEDIDTLDNALTETRQGIYMAKIFNEVLTSITNVYSSIINNSVNQIMKALTSFTIIIMVPTFITSMYGMNVELPFQQHGNAFLMISIICLLLIGLIFVFMRRWRIL